MPVLTTNNFSEVERKQRFFLGNTLWDEAQAALGFQSE